MDVGSEPSLGAGIGCVAVREEASNGVPLFWGLPRNFGAGFNVLKLLQIGRE